MPSEERIAHALEILAHPIEKYRSAVVHATEEVRGLLATHRADDGRWDDGVAATLGAFASGRIDVNRFATLVTHPKEKPDPATLDKVEKAFHVLQNLSSAGDKAFYLKVSPAARLRDCIASRLSEIGRGFAAARIAGLAALGVLRNGDAEELLAPLGFDAWNSGERRMAPPLVVELEGADLHAAELAEFLDGNVKMVLVVNGDAPPAALVRLITPRTFVLQASEAEDLARFAAAEPPAIAAWMPSNAACFVHDPARGAHVGDRLSILRLPETPPRKKLGGISAAQQQEELDQLQALASAADAGAPSEVPAATPGGQMTSVDKLAAWLLSQTDLSDPG